MLNENIFTLIVFIVVLSVLIVGHELGHYLAAKWRGVKVEEFGLGFPPRIATLFQIQETKFTLNLLPLGGFVRPAGEDDPDVPGGLASSSKTTRALVLLAGPAANFILALLAFTIAFKFAAPDSSRIMITGVNPDTPAAEAGLLAGDIILEAEGVTINSFDVLQETIAERLGEDIALQVERAGEELTLNLVPRTEFPDDQGPIGITLGNPARPTNWPEAAQLGVQSTFLQIRAMVTLPGRLIQGEIAPEEARVSGLRGMYDMFDWAGEIDRSSQRPFLTLNLIGVISAGLALLNLMPIPALDGGRMMFVLFEAVTGKRLSPQQEGLAHTIGFMLLLVLILYINIQDFVNPINLPR